MKITLIIILMNLQTYMATTNGSQSNLIISGQYGCTNSTCANAQTSWKKISFPMPDLKSCLDARHQFDDYSMLISAACSAE